MWFFCEIGDIIASHNLVTMSIFEFPKTRCAGTPILPGISKHNAVTMHDHHHLYNEQP